MFKFKNDKLKELINLRIIRKVDLRKHLGYSNDETINRWVKGSEIQASKLAEICNLTKIPILEFFEFDEEDILPYQINTQSEPAATILPVDADSIDHILEREREINKMKINHQREIFTLKELHLKELTQNTLKLKDEERENLNKQRMQDWERFEEKFKEKDKELAQVKEAFLKLQLQHKELELSASHARQHPNTSTIANESGTAYKK